jgi:hypothetical protein
MSDVRITIEADEFISGFSLNEKKKLLQLLKTDLGEEADKPISEDYKVRGLPTSEVYVDIYDILWDLSSWDKKRLYEELKDEVGDDCDCSDNLEEAFEPDSYQAEQLAKAFIKLWEARHMLTPQQVERIQAITRESYV